jgi:hypothetical protein
MPTLHREQKYCNKAKSTGYTMKQKIILFDVEFQPDKRFEMSGVRNSRNVFQNRTLHQQYVTQYVMGSITG